MRKLVRVAREEVRSFRSAVMLAFRCAGRGTGAGEEGREERGEGKRETNRSRRGCG